MYLGFVFLLSSFLRLVIADDDDDWSTPSFRRANAVRSQRDVSSNVSIDQFTSTGVSLSNTVFASEGYTLSALENVLSILKFGVENIVVDLYWNEHLKKFQLCPVQFGNSLDDFTNKTEEYFQKGSVSYKCQVGMKLDDLINTLLTYLKDSDTNLYANLVVLIFNLNYLNKDIAYDASITGGSNDTLSMILNTYFGDRLYTPALLKSDRLNHLTYDQNQELSTYGYPNLTQFLFTSKNRMLATIWNDNIPSNSSYNDKDQDAYIFNQSTFGASIYPYSEISDITNEYAFNTTAKKSWRYAYDTPDDKFSAETIYKMVSNGYTPIVNHTLQNVDDIMDLLNGSLWSWNSTEPLSQQDARRLYEEDDEKVLQKAYQCATTNQSGTWFVSNCYRSTYVVCRNNYDQFDWVLNTNRYTYFHASDACTDGYSFTVPKTALQQKSLNDYLLRINVNESVWIDLNSIAVDDCWVTGGPYASCPYQTVASSRNFVKMITPTSVLSFVILVLIFLLRLKSVPVQDNRKHWKKLVTQYAENEYEGVPS